MDAMLDSKTSSLCFNREEFSSDDFSVDKFVSDCRKYASLETMQEDLNLYHKMLCAALIELINQDYTDFLNLSSTLVGLDKTIKNVSTPLEQLKNKIENCKSNLDKTSESAASMFSEREEVYKMKVLVRHVLCVLNGLKKIEDINPKENDLPLDVFERVASDWNLVKFHSRKACSVSDVLNHKKEEVENVSLALETQLENLFLQNLSNENLLKVLRIYSILNDEQNAEKCFRKKIINPFVKNLITEDNITKLGLEKVYELILEFIPNNCNYLLKVTRRTNTHAEFIPGYDFLVNAFFPEIVHCFDYVAPVYVYAPGAPELFHKNYVASIEFLEKLEQYCQVQASVRRLRNHPSYQTFLSKFNLDLYFQIRFQEIAGLFECSFLQPFDSSSNLRTNETGETYALNSTIFFLHCLKLCWDDSIFLVSLRRNFWQLTLQLLSRYFKWAYSYLKTDQSDNSATKTALLIKDVERICPELVAYFQRVIQPKLHEKDQENVFELAFKESVSLLEEIPTLASANIVALLIKQCSVHLKLILDIPRLYRKTNRQMPTKPSGYMSQINNCLTSFQVETENVLPVKCKNRCLENVVEGIVVQSLEIVRDVLTSIKKMEDSLKILKRARENKATVDNITTSPFTDDDKIRRQLAIDVEYLEQLITNLGIEASGVKSFCELKDLVTSVEKSAGSS